MNEKKKVSVHWLVVVCVEGGGEEHFLYQWDKAITCYYKFHETDLCSSCFESVTVYKISIATLKKKKKDLKQFFYFFFFIFQSSIATQVQEHIAKAEANFEKRDYRTVSFQICAFF